MKWADFYADSRMAANLSDEDKFIIDYLRNNTTQDCLNKVRALLNEHYVLSVKQSKKEYILEGLGRNTSCKGQVNKAFAELKRVRNKNLEGLFTLGELPLGKSEIKMIRNLEALKLNKGTAVNLVKGARNLPGSPASYAHVPAADAPPPAGALFGGDVNQYTTVAKLDAYIGRIAADKMERGDVTMVEGAVSDTIGDLCEAPLNDFKARICSWLRMKSSGAEFDCLIHSFLNMISPNYRRLADDDKDPIASAFRRLLLPRITDSKESQKRLMKSYEFLTDTELDLLSRIYKLSFIIFEEGRSERISGSRRMRGQWTQPSSITYKDEVPSRDEFYMLSLSGSHYEAVRTSDGFYTVDRTIKDRIAREFPPALAENARPACEYKGTDIRIEDGDIVLYKGKKEVVLNRRFDGDPPRCIEITISGQPAPVKPDTLTFVSRAAANGAAAAAANGSGAAGPRGKPSYENWLETINEGVKSALPPENLRQLYRAMGGAKRSGRTRRSRRHSGNPRSRSLRRRR